VCRWRRATTPVRRAQRRPSRCVPSASSPAARSDPRRAPRTCARATARRPAVRSSGPHARSVVHAWR
ncbi:MAG: hypothetical protein ACK55I_19525, partial [bacterium]